MVLGAERSGEPPRRHGLVVGGRVPSTPVSDWRRRRLRRARTSATSAGPAGLARSLLADASDADDVVAEVFAATFAAMRDGRGPADDFRSYVLTLGAAGVPADVAARRGDSAPAASRWSTSPPPAPSDCDEIEQRTEDEIVQRAFASLPAHMREVLWASEVERPVPRRDRGADRLDECRRGAQLDRAGPPAARRALPRRPPPRRRGEGAGTVRRDPPRCSPRSCAARPAPPNAASPTTTSRCARRACPPPITCGSSTTACVLATSSRCAGPHRVEAGAHRPAWPGSSAGCSARPR